MFKIAEYKDGARLIYDDEYATRDEALAVIDEYKRDDATGSDRRTGVQYDIVEI